MHRKWVKDWRKTLDSAIWTMPPLHYKVWKWILYRADYKTGILKTSLGMIADGVQWEEFGVFRIPNRKTISSILDRLETEKMITRESNRLCTTITIVNWATYNNQESDKVTADGQPFGLPSGLPSGHYSRSKHEKSKEEDQNLLSETSSDLFGKLEKAEAKPEPKARTKRESTVDPLTNSRTFLDRVEASENDVDIVWDRDGKLVKTKLTSRKVKVTDPQAEIWSLWEKFISGAIDGAYSMNDRPHNIPTFISHYAALLEFGNGKAKFTCKSCSRPATLRDDGIVRCSGPVVHGYKKEIYGL